MSGKLQPPKRGIGGRELAARERGRCMRCDTPAALFAQETAGGLKGVWWCNRCERVAFAGASFAKLTDEQRATLPRLTANKQPCSVCGKVAVLEWHHLAPRAQFGDDAEKWPQTAVCHECHRDWERRTGIGPAAQPTTTEAQIPFGKYKGRTWREIAVSDPGYLQWFIENIDRRGLVVLAKQALEEARR